MELAVLVTNEPVSHPSRVTVFNIIGRFHAFHPPRSEVNLGIRIAEEC